MCSFNFTGPLWWRQTLLETAECIEVLHGYWEEKLAHQKQKLSEDFAQAKTGIDQMAPEKGFINTWTTVSAEWEFTLADWNINMNESEINLFSASGGK